MTPNNYNIYELIYLMESVKNTKEDYNEKARENSNKHQRELKATF